MSDEGYFECLRESTRSHRRECKAKNTKALEESGLAFHPANGGEALLFREKDKPKVDFYPSTGRWRVAGVKKTFNGGAAAFMRWYATQ